MTRYQMERLIDKYNKLLYSFEYDASRLRKSGWENSAISLLSINRDLRAICQAIEDRLGMGEW